MKDGLEELEARHVWVAGRVQGVAFRWYSREEAERLGVRGWIRNCADGRVEIHAEAAPAALDAFLAFLRKGPSAARVEALDVAAAEPEGHAGFAIVR